jgi:hypothetical protein
MKNGNGTTEHGGMSIGHYAKFLIMTILMFISMYILMYAMVNSFSNVYNNVNQFYMAGLMTAPMVLIEILLMGSMYRNKTINLAIIVASVVALVGFWFLIREQTAVTDKQFIRSMIPHHSGAILMCREAVITDAELKQLCGEIISSQQREIDEMEQILDRLQN